ncbi:MAG: MFS transporter [Anaerolineales bacterium]|nr:MFS transporter [Anaerolineales bacterium]MCA9966144.1 MFS transporter [Anaerolineales bacterium]
MILWQNRNFRLLWLAQIISGMGDVLYSVGVMVHVFQQTGSALQTTGVLIAQSLPRFLLGPIAGAMVDHYPRQRVLIVMDLVRAGLVGLLLLFVQQGSVNLWGIYLVVAGITAASTFYQPARIAIVPSLVERFNLVRANSVLVGTAQGTMAVGYMLGGLLTLRIAFGTFVLFNLLTFLVSATLTALMHIKPRSEAEKQAQKSRLPLRQSVREGYVYLKDNPVVRPLVVMELLEHVPHGIWTSALMLVFAEKALRAGADAWGTMSALYFAGMMVGAVVASVAAKRLERYPGLIIGGNALASGVLTLLFALSPVTWVAVVLAFLFGPPSAVRDVVQDTLLQTVADDELLGRVYALREMGRWVVYMLAGLLFAWLADSMPIRTIYLLGGGLYLLTAVYALANKPLRQSQIIHEQPSV